jgi:hypothetical protein
VTCTIPSEPASANPRIAALSVCDEVTLTARQAECVPLDVHRLRNAQYPLAASAGVETTARRGMKLRLGS